MKTLLCAMMTYYKVVSQTYDRTTMWDKSLDIEVPTMMATMILVMKLYVDYTRDFFSILGGVAVVVIVYVFLAISKTTQIRRTLSQSLRFFCSLYSFQSVSFSRVTICTFFQLPGPVLRPLRA